MRLPNPAPVRRTMDAPRAGPPGACGRPSRVRHGVLALLALAAVVSYLSRICLSTANTTIQREFGFTNEQMGRLLSAFFLGYMAFQVPTGWLGQRFGGRVTLAALTALASLCSIATALAGSLAALWWSRFGLGVMQAGLVPCASRGVVDWFPTTSRGRASSLISGSMSLGAVLANGITAALLPVLGWRGVFWAYAGVGLLWTVAYYGYFRDRPQEHPRVNAAELAEIRGGAASPALEVPEKAPTRPSAERWELILALATSPTMWLLCGQAWFRAFGAAFFLTWFPAYLEKGHGVRLQETGFLAMLPLAGGVVGALTGGFVVDWVLRRTGSLRLSRSVVSAAVLAACAGCTLLAARAAGPVAMVLLLSLGYFFFGNGGPASWAIQMDVSGKHTQIVFALSNMCGNFAAMVCPWVVGKLFDRIEAGGGDWSQVLYLFAGVYLLGAVCAAAIDPNRSAVSRQRRP